MVKNIKVKKSWFITLIVMLSVFILLTVFLFIWDIRLNGRLVKTEQYQECLDKLNVAQKQAQDAEFKTRMLQGQLDSFTSQSNKCAIDYANCTHELKECKDIISKPSNYNLWIGSLNYNYGDIYWIISFFFGLCIVLPISIAITLFKFKLMEVKFKIGFWDSILIVLLIGIIILGLYAHSLG